MPSLKQILVDDEAGNTRDRVIGVHSLLSSPPACRSLTRPIPSYAGAYGWAFVKPIRKLYYNITITLVSIVVTFAVGGIETLGLATEQFHLTGRFWNFVGRLNDNFDILGYFIIGLFATSWIISIAVYRWRQLDSFEVNA